MPTANCVRKVRTFNESISKVHCSDRKGGRGRNRRTSVCHNSTKAGESQPGSRNLKLQGHLFITKHTEVFGQGHGAQVQAQVVLHVVKRSRIVTRGSHVTQFGLGRELRSYSLHQHK